MTRYHGFAPWSALPEQHPRLTPGCVLGYLIRLSFASDVLDEPYEPPRHATSSCEVPAEHRPDPSGAVSQKRLVTCLSRVLTWTLTPVRLRVEGGQEDRGVGLREVPVLECR